MSISSSRVNLTGYSVALTTCYWSEK